MLILSSVIYMFAGVRFGSYFWSAITLFLLSVIVIKKEGKLVKYRVFAIITSLIVIALNVVEISVFYGGALRGIIFILFALMMFFVSLILVPPVFTEYNSIAKHIFFSVITCDIWQVIWIYHLTKNLNKVALVEKRKPGRETFFCLVLPFYFAYWLYKTAEGVEAYGEENGKKYKISLLCLALAMVCPFVSTIIIQDKINQIVGKPE